jgi:hypothetical protein
MKYAHNRAEKSTTPCGNVAADGSAVGTSSLPRSGSGFTL